MRFLVFIVAVICFGAVDAVITYQLYTKMNPKMGQPLTYKNPKSIYKSFFNSAKKNKYQDLSQI